MERSIFTITRTAPAKKILHRMNEEEIVALDMEFNMNEKRLCLIQIALPTGEIYIFDVVVCEDILSLKFLKTLMESTKTKKIIHGGDNDSKILHEFYLQDKSDPVQISLNGVIDTQVLQRAADTIENANCRIEGQSLSSLCRRYQVQGLNEELKDKFKGNYHIFEERINGELSPRLKEYAADDVGVLFPLYKKMKSKFDDEKVRQKYETLLQKHLYKHLEIGHVPERKRKRMAAKRKRKAVAK